MRRGLFLLLVLVSGRWGCAPIPESEILPVMGLSGGSGEEEKEEAAVQAEAGDDSLDALASVLVFLPFKDNSKYKGDWDIYVEFPRGLADTLRSRHSFRVVPVNRVLPRLEKKERKGMIPFGKGLEIGRSLKADFVIFGEIDELSMKRFRATVPIGGYRSYQGVTEVTLRLVNAIDGQPAGELSRLSEVDSKRYGITNPAAFVPLEKEYFLLNEMEWGSEEFHKTLLGQSVGKCMSQLAAALDSLIGSPPRLSVSEPKIIDIDGVQAYINAGVADSVQNGNKFGVWDHGRELTDPDTGMLLGRALPRRVGVVQVEQVLSEHLSLVRILEGADRIRTGYTLRAE